MKILGGQLKGRNFYMPADIRPTQNLVRKAIFDVLGDVGGLEFLELFAGSGAVSFEALSLGAKSVTLIERDDHCLEVIRENMRLLKLDSFENFQKSSLGLVELITADIFPSIKQLALKKRKFDVIFVDPPFGHGLGKKTLKALRAYDILHPNCFIIIQGEKNEILPSCEGRFLLVREKNYGASQLSFYSSSNEFK